jgi:hypothetical protein
MYRPMTSPEPKERPYGRGRESVIFSPVLSRMPYEYPSRPHGPPRGASRRAQPRRTCAPSDLPFGGPGRSDAGAPPPCSIATSMYHWP